VCTGVPNEMCQQLAGFHRTFGDRGDGLAVVQRCPIAPGARRIDQLTRVASHEIAEAATDTGLGFALVLPPGTPPQAFPVETEIEGTGVAEIGDLCTGTAFREGAFLYQRIFSNSAARTAGDFCIPALPTPYFNTSAAQDWFAGGASSTVNVPLTGWSTAPTASWIVLPRLLATSDRNLPFTATVSSPTSRTVAGTTFATVNNGGGATLSVTVPSGAPSGAFVVVLLESIQLDENDRVVGPDLFHPWPVGVFVP
jgi:hypothetical protein